MVRRWVALCLGLGGCALNAQSMPYMDTPEAALVCHRPEEVPAKVQCEGRHLWRENKNVALYNLTLGMAAMELAVDELARDAFVRATEVMQFSVGAERGEVSLLLMENIKYFKGGLHEQQMALLMLGMAFANLGDLEGARASFLRALASDDTSLTGFRDDNALTYYLLARTYSADGDVDNARIARTQALALASWCTACGKERLATDNVVLIVGIGRPLMRIWGASAATDVYVTRPSATQGCTVEVGGASHGCELMFDALEQVAGRDVVQRHVYQVVKGVASEVAQPWLDRALGGSFTKLGLDMIGKADLRASPVMTQGLAIVSLSLAPGRQEIDVVARDAQGARLAEESARVVIDVPRTGELYRYVRLGPHRNAHGWQCGTSNRFGYPDDDARFQADYEFFR